MLYDGAVAHVGIQVLRLAVPGSRSLKDRRRAVVALRDRIRARFEVSCHEIIESEAVGQGVLIVTTGGGDGRMIAGVLDQVESLAASRTDLIVSSVEREVRRWPDPVPWKEEEP